MSMSINSLLSQKRMSHGLDNPANFLIGLNELIKKYFMNNFVGAEIGSYEGASTELFLQYVDHLYSIDPYNLGNNFEQESMDDLIRAENVYINRLKNYTNYSKIKENSLNASKKFENEILDFVYIDGSHKYIDVKNDIITWLPKIKINGYICGHDYFGEIKEAVNEILGNPIEIFDDSSWIFIKKGN